MSLDVVTLATLATVTGYHASAASHGHGPVCRARSTGPASPSFSRVLKARVLSQSMEMPLPFCPFR